MTFPPRKPPTRMPNLSELIGGKPASTLIMGGGISEGVVELRKKPVPIAEHEGEHWQSATDMLRELLNDIETKRIAEPDVIYVAMRNSHPENAGLVSYPSYCWSAFKMSGLVMMGLLTKHTAKIAS